MIQAVLAVAVAAGTALALAFAPVAIGVDLRRTIAVLAVQAGVPQLGAALLTPLADLGDPAAQNNLGVLLNRGIGIGRDPVRAAELLNAAANAGLARAQMNLILMRTPCNTQHTMQTIAKLKAFADAGDRRAASFIADCLNWPPSALSFREAGRQLIEAAAIATKSGDPDEELKFGWLLMLQIDRVRGSGLEPVARDTARAAASYLLRAAEHGRPAGYEGLSLLHQKFLNLLDPGPERDKVAARNPTEWIDLAAQAGHPKSRCAVGVRLGTELAQRPASATETTRRRFQEYFEACVRGRNPRQVILRDGKERTLGHDRLLDIWMREDPFLAISPGYDNYDYDTVARDDALAKMTQLMRRR